MVHLNPDRGGAAPILSPVGTRPPRGRSSGSTRRTKSRAAPWRGLTVRGKRLEAAWHGPGPAQAPTLVFLHDGLGCVELWRDFPRIVAAATGCGALVYSRPGHGKSDPTEARRSLRFMHEEALLLPEILDAAGVRKAVLVGQSDGGSIAIIHAGSPGAGDVLAVVAEAAHVFCEEKTRQAITAAMEDYRHGTLRQKLLRYHGKNVDSVFGGWAGAWLDAGFADWNIEAYLRRVRVPLLAIQGDTDEYGSIRQLDAIRAGSGGPVERLVVAGAGHSPHREQPERIAWAIAAFLEPVLRRSRGGWTGS
jgi:pimeloyl-ACP methyl ester carboxylesterase